MKYTFILTSYNVVTMVTNRSKWYLFRDSYTLCWMHWFVSHLIYLSLTKPTMQQCFHPSTKYFFTDTSQLHKGVRKWGLGSIPLSFIFYKTFCLWKRYELFSHIFSLLICRVIEIPRELICVHISKNIANGPKSDN